MMAASTSQKVSIITCFLNAESFIVEAIHSIIAQYHSNWELLLIDDGSTDKSTYIAKDFAAQYSNKIFYYQHEGHINKGLSASRNLAIKMITGDLVTFLDADDVWLPNYLSHQIDVLHKSNATMVCEGTIYWYSWIDPRVQDRKVLVGISANKLYYPPQLIMDLYPLGKGAAPCVCGLIVKKEVFQKYGGFDDAFPGMYEDQVFLSKIYLNEPVFVSEACNNVYRQRRDSLVGSSLNQKVYYEVRIQFLQWLRNYIQENNNHFSQVDLLINKALSRTGALFPYYFPKIHLLTTTLPKVFINRFKEILSPAIKKLK